MGTAALFTTDNAREMALRSAVARKARQEADKLRFESEQKALAELAQSPAFAGIEASRIETIRQIRLIDSKFDKTPIKLWPALTQAKARLWELLYPKPGSLKPKQSKRSDSSDAQPLA